MKPLPEFFNFLKENLLYSSCLFFATLIIAYYLINKNILNYKQGIISYIVFNILNYCCIKILYLLSATNDEILLLPIVLAIAEGVYALIIFALLVLLPETVRIMFFKNKTTDN
jgi:hypothetical protein